MFFHGYDNYMNHAFPDDELKPLSCTGRRRDGKNPRGTMDDSLGDYSLTLVDTMDTLVILGDYHEFQKAVSNVTYQVHFDRDVTVNLFEVNIRVLGGLLSSHIFASLLKEESLSEQRNGKLLHYQQNLAEQFKKLNVEELTPHQKRIIHQVSTRERYFVNYHNELLKLALDLGLRLLPAFYTNSKIPYSKINLKRGIIPQEDTTCLAGAGSLSLEFITLSQLTGYPIFKVFHFSIVLHVFLVG